MLWTCCTQCANIWKTQQWPQDWKRSIFIPIPKKGNAKACSNYHTIALISHTSKVMLKIQKFKIPKFMDTQAPYTLWCGTLDLLTGWFHILGFNQPWIVNWSRVGQIKGSWDLMVQWASCIYLIIRYQIVFKVFPLLESTAQQRTEGWILSYENRKYRTHS